jgi:hypothetical protein
MFNVAELLVVVPAIFVTTQANKSPLSVRKPVAGVV